MSERPCCERKVPDYAVPTPWAADERPADLYALICPNLDCFHRLRALVRTPPAALPPLDAS